MPILLALTSLACLAAACNDSLSDSVALALVFASPLFMAASIAFYEVRETKLPVKSRLPIETSLRIVRSWK